ncbi:MAG: hypothetical protein MZU97_09370 [Bacillus subtilis]|nr:hypothetical protein [Bacillus subtilis]
MNEYVLEAINLAFFVIPKQEVCVLPPRGMAMPQNNFFNDEKNYSSLRQPDVDKALKNSGKIPWSDQKDKHSHTKTDKSPVAKPDMLESRKIHTGR